MKFWSFVFALMLVMMIINAVNVGVLMYQEDGLSMWIAVMAWVASVIMALYIAYQIEEGVVE